MKETYNIALTNLSLVVSPVINQYLAFEGSLDEKLSKLNENIYVYEDIEVRGVMTNEAGIKYIIQKLKKFDDRLDSILFIKSDAAEKQMSVNTNIRDKDGNAIKKEADINHVKFFKNRLSLYCQEMNIDKPSYLVEEGLTIGDDPNPEDLINLSAKIANRIIQLKETVAKDKVINLYIESNGGIRDFMLLVVAIIQSISKDIATVKEVVGINFKYEDPKHPIRNKTQAYRVYDLYSGIDEFINYGRSNKISYFFKDLNLLDEEKDILDSIELMSIAFTLCKPLEMIKATDNLNKAVDKYKNLNKLSNLYEVFNLLINRIQTEYQQIFDDIQNGDIHDFSVLKDFIQYCIKHNLIQQALTLYSELMPNVMYNNEIFYPSKTVKIQNETLESIFKKYYKKNYKRGDQSEGYVFIQQYMLIRIKGIRDSDMRQIYDMGMINIYNSQHESQKLDYWKKMISLHRLIEHHYILTQCNEVESAIQIMKDYLDIKAERNKSNHASVSRGTNDNLNGELNRVVNMLEKSMDKIERLLDK